MLKNNSFIALVKREVLENQNSFIKVPAIVLGIVILLVIAFVMGLTQFDFFHDSNMEGVSDFGDMVALASSEATKEGVPFNFAITAGYWGISYLPLMILPFIVFFSLLGSLYEERRDRTIMFWKSMPISDWQEVLAKIVASAVVAPMCVLAVIIVGQLIAAVILSLTSLVQGGPFFVMWPLWTMFISWIHVFIVYMVYIAWILPLLSWLVLASAYAPRMPFMYGVLPPVLVAVVQGVFFDSTAFLEWMGERMSGIGIINDMDVNVNLDKAGSVEGILDFSILGNLIGNVLMTGGFWFGLVVAGGFLYGAVELRKRAI